MDRIVAQTIISEDYLENPDLREQDQNYLSTLDKTERDRINRLARIFNTLYKDDPKVYMLNQDLSYYQHMAPEKRAKINRLIGQKALGKQSTFELDPGDKRYLRNLNNKETARVFRLIAIRKASRKLFGEDLELDYQALQQSDVMAKINTFNSQQYGNVTITGKLIHLISGLPASEIEIPLMNEKGEVIKITTTSRDGSFRYSNLPANQHFRVVAEAGNKKLTDVDKYFIKDLNITGSQKIAGKIKYENIYFNFNSAILRDEAKIVLGELVVLAKNNPEMQVEMNAFTDHTGSDEYNLALSQKRGKAAFAYLVNSGMPRTSLVMNARGKASPAASNLNRYGRQLNRRVEFEIFGKDVDFVSSYTTYIVRPKTTLYSLARSFDMTVDELIKINGLTSKTISAYSPIRVNKTNKVDYGLVFQGSASPKGYQQYSVREGETIYSVAERFQIPEELLMEINGLSNPNLKPGQLLNIYIQ